ncbi:MAG TPA: hypothetical protein GXZ74_09465 [Tissierellia bacterium]|nr:hypothetical protein [Tissierellia bacterium]
MDMIRSYIETMFRSWPENEATERVKTQLSELMEDKYQALIEEGASHNEALGQVISEFGNIDELRQELGIETDEDLSADEISHKEREILRKQKKAQRHILMDNFWIVLTVVYFLVSFMTGWWHISWLLFVVAVPLQSYLNYLLKQSEEEL